jgi:hypothetical protein
MSSQRFVGRLLAPLVLVLALTLAAACSNSSDKPATPSTVDSGIVGLVTIEGGPIISPTPASRELLDVHAGDQTGEVVATVRSAGDGTFMVALPPGRYTVVAVPDDDKSAEPASATVSSGAWAKVTIRFSVR